MTLNLHSILWSSIAISLCFPFVGSFQLQFRQCKPRSVTENQIKFSERPHPAVILFADNHPTVILFADKAGVSEQDISVDNVKGSTEGGLVSFGSNLRTQLVSAFSALDESDQYDAVLTGLCAKVLDDPSNSGDKITVALQDPIRLLEEMNTRKISASPRSLMALIDVRSFQL